MRLGDIHAMSGRATRGNPSIQQLATSIYHPAYRFLTYQKRDHKITDLRIHAKGLRTYGARDSRAASIIKEKHIFRTERGSGARGRFFEAF
jgi:hypothetical protein